MFFAAQGYLPSNEDATLRGLILGKETFSTQHIRKSECREAVAAVQILPPIGSL
jgi:hypothetical protein